MARICGICKRPPREGEDMGFLRVHGSDVTPDLVAALLRGSPEPGLYSACGECKESYRGAVALRVGKEPDALTHNEWA